MDNKGEQPSRDIPEQNPPQQNEAEKRRTLYRGIAQKTLIGLGHGREFQEVQAIGTRNDPGLNLKMIAEEEGIDATKYNARGIDAATKRIASIPDEQAARKLIMTALFGIPANSNPTEDIVAGFPVATSSSLVTTDINPIGQSQSKPKPDLKGTQELLKSMLQETGFLANNTAEEDFKKIRAELNKGVTLAHPNYSGLSISIRPTEPGTYGIKIINRKI